MRCQKVQQLMNDKTYRNESIDIQLAKHIRNCRSCSAHATASQILNRAFRIERVKSAESETPLSYWKTRIEALASHQSVKERNVMPLLKDRIFNHPLMSFSFAGAFVLLLLAATVPVSCSRTVGYSVGVAGDDSPIAEAITSDADGTASITFQKNSEGHIAQFDSKRIMEAHIANFDSKRIIEALRSLGISNAKLELSASDLGQTITISGLENREQARNALLAIVEVAGVGEKAELTHRQASFSCSLIEHALNGIHEIFVDSDGLSDEEIRSQIVARLEEAGVMDAEVQYLTGEDGQKMMFIGQGAECDSMLMQQVFEWKAEGGGDATFNFEGYDSTMIIEIKSDDKTQTIDVKKTITSDFYK